MNMESNTLTQNSNTDQKNGEGPFTEALIVFFDIDTTDKNSKKAEICQIAAWHNEKQFREFILPNDEIDHLCNSKNGFRKDRKGKLIHYNNVVEALAPKDGLQEFLNFLSGLTEKPCNILLAAHNCKSFHRNIILRHLEQYSLLQEFKSLVLGFIDTLPVFKSKLNVKKGCGLEELSHKYIDQESIPQQQHAGVKVKILVDLIKNQEFTDAMMKQYVELILFIELKDDFEKVVTDNQLRKIAEAGISTKMLKDAYSADNDSGVANLLKQGKAGKADLKLTNDTIKKINDKVSKLFKK